MTTQLDYVCGLIMDQPVHTQQHICTVFRLQLTDVLNHLRHILYENVYFLRGFIEMTALIKDYSPETTSPPFCILKSNNQVLLERIQVKFETIPCEMADSAILFQGVNMLDFLGHIYTNAPMKGDLNEFKTTNSSKFTQWLYHTQSHPVCLFKKEEEDAVIPFKCRFSDVGYDLTIIDKVKTFNSSTTLYDTGISLSIPYGYYAEIVPRSSLSKTGYMLANSVGIIDNSYRGRLFIPLVKVCSDSPPLTLPMTCCQLIFKKQEFVWMEEIETLTDTSRGKGGFGSTNK